MLFHIIFLDLPSSDSDNYVIAVKALIKVLTSLTVKRLEESVKK